MGDERARAIESLRRDGARHLKASLASLSRDVAASIRLCSRDFGVLGRELVTALQQRERREHAAARALETERRRRRRLQHQLTGAQGGLRVLCRVRPPLRPDDHPPLPSSSHYPHVDSDSPKLKHLRVEVESEQELRVCSAVDGIAVKRFCFQRVLDEESTQERVFRDVAPLVHAALDGRHACVFAYGQVGAGKTHSMLGSTSDRGVFFRAAEMVCAAAAEQQPLATLTLSLTLVEVYNEEVYDLLASSFTAGTGTGAQPPMQFFSPPSSVSLVSSVSASTRSAVEIRHGDTGVYLKNVTTVAIDTVDAVYAAIHRGVANRSTNEQSSRSHCVLTLGIVRQSRTSGETTAGRLVLVDLAGSERLAKTTTAGLRLREAQYIHKSLSALSDVMAALLAREKHIPFRNSKLTHLLQDSLSGGSDNPALVLVHVSADAADVSETVDTLQFAARITSVQVGGKRPSEHAEITRLNAVVSAQSSQLQALHEKLAAELELRKKYEKRLEEYRQDESRRRAREDELKKQHALTPLANSALLSPEQQIAARRWSLYSRKDSIALKSARGLNGVENISENILRSRSALALLPEEASATFNHASTPVCEKRRLSVYNANSGASGDGAAAPSSLLGKRSIASASDVKSILKKQRLEPPPPEPESSTTSGLDSQHSRQVSFLLSPRTPSPASQSSLPPASGGGRQLLRPASRVPAAGRVRTPVSSFASSPVRRVVASTPARVKNKGNIGWR